MIDYIKDSYHELKNKVTWPSYAEAQKLTVTVLVVSIIFAFLVWGVDTIFSSLLEQYFNWVK